MASKRRLRRKACEGKQRHPTRDGALIACRRTGSGAQEGLGVYRCKHCAAWHVGHRPGSSRIYSILFVE